MGKPEFDPSKPFQVAMSDQKPAFDPSKPFDPAEEAKSDHYFGPGGSIPAWLQNHPTLSSLVRGTTGLLPIGGALAGGAGGVALGMGESIPTAGLAGPPLAVANGVAGAGIGGGLGKGAELAANRYLLGDDKSLEESAHDVGSSMMDNAAAQGAGELIGAGAKTAAGTKLGQKAIGAAGDLSAKVGETFTGIPSKVLKTFAKNEDQIAQMSKAADGNEAEAADLIRDNTMNAIKRFKGEQNSAIGETLKAADPNARHDIQPIVDALHAQKAKYNASANPEAIEAIDSLIAKVQAHATPTSADLKYLKDMKEFLPKHEQYLAQRDAFLKAVGSAGEDAAQPILPGVIDDLQRTTSRSNPIELHGMPASKASLGPTPELTQQGFLPDLPNFQSEFGGVKGGGRAESAARAASGGTPGIQKSFLDQGTKEQLSMLGRQGEMSGLDLTPRTHRMVEQPGVEQGFGQTHMPVEPAAPLAPMAPETLGKHTVTSIDLNRIRQMLQDEADGAYAKAGEIFNRASPSAQAAKNGAAKTRELLNLAHPEVAGANAKLSQLHDLEDVINPNLIGSGRPHAALTAAGSGGNVRSVKQLGDLGNLVGEDLTTPVDNLKAMQVFDKPALMPADTTGKAAGRMGLASGIGWLAGGPVGAVTAAGLTSPMTAKVAIQGGKALGRAAGTAAGKQLIGQGFHSFMNSGGSEPDNESVPNASPEQIMSDNPGNDSASKFLLSSPRMQQLQQKNPEAFNQMSKSLSNRVSNKRNELDSDSSKSSSYRVTPVSEEESRKSFLDNN